MKKFKRVIISALIIILVSKFSVFSQNVGISDTEIDPHNSAVLELRSSSKGLLIPRVSLTATNDLSTVNSPAESLLVYNLSTLSDVTPGFYYFKDGLWHRLGSETFDTNAWELTGNAGTNSSVNFLGTTDAQDLVFRTSNLERLRILSSNGNVGINLTNPINRLGVNGGVAIGSFAGNHEAPENGMIISGLVRIGIPNASTIHPDVEDSERIILDVTGGYTRIGNYNADPGVGGVAPGSGFAQGVGALSVGVNRESGNSHIDLWNTTAHGMPSANENDARGFQFRRYNNFGDEQILMTLNGLGNLFIVGTLSQGSDKRIKTNLKKLDSKTLDKLMLLEPTYYQKIDVANNPDGTLKFNESIEKENEIGFIAQEVYKLFPELVHKPEDENKEIWAVDYSKFSVILTKSIQEQQEMILKQQKLLEEQQKAIEFLLNEVKNLSN